MLSHAQLRCAIALRPVQLFEKTPPGPLVQFSGMFPPWRPQEPGASVPDMDSKLDMDAEPNSETNELGKPTPAGPGDRPERGRPGLKVWA